MQDKTYANIIGPDLNEYRDKVDFVLLATKTNFCYLRGSGNGSGKFRADRKFIEYAAGLKNVGIKSGAYHYAVPSYDLTTADEQCDGFIDVLQQAYGQGKYGDLFPVIDIEAPVDKSISTDALLDWVDRFRKRFERKTRRKLMLYTGSFFIDLYNNFYSTTKGFILSDMPLWIAMYPEIQPNPPYPQDQGGWTRWRIWQFTENGTIAGVNPPVDLNYGPVNVDFLSQPRNVTDLNAIPEGETIRVTWAKNPDIDLAGYNIFLNSQYITTVGKDVISYTIDLDKAQNAGQRYEVSIEAFDSDGDFSPERTKVEAVFPRTLEMDGKYNTEFIEDIEDDDFIDYSELEKRNNKRIEYYSDPVDRLEKKYIYDDYDDGINRFEIPEDAEFEFAEVNGEFDDEHYLEKITEEEERHHGNNNSSSDKQQGCSDKKCKKDKCKCKNKNYGKPDSAEDKEDDDIKWEELKKCGCEEKEGKKKEDKVKASPKKEKIKCDYDDSDSDSDSDSDEDDIVEEKDKDKKSHHGSDSYGECILGEGKKKDGCKCKNRYEGDRRRWENQDKQMKYSTYNYYDDSSEAQTDGTAYLRNCDYGFGKHNKRRGHGDIYYGKKRKHKHH